LPERFLTIRSTLPWELTRRSNKRFSKGEIMHILVWIGIVLLVLWAILWLGFKIVSGIVHLLVILAVIMIIWGLVKKGAGAVRNRM
jgi:uncharacterized membrane protein (DUF485 family)